MLLLEFSEPAVFHAPLPSSSHWVLQYRWYLAGVSDDTDPEPRQAQLQLSSSGFDHAISVHRQQEQFHKALPLDFAVARFSYFDLVIAGRVAMNLVL